MPIPVFEGRFVSRAVWRIERALEEARDQTGVGSRQRILVVLVAFCLVYSILAAGAIKAALFNPDARADAYAPLPAGARADLVDRNGELLAANLLHYGLFIDPREIWDSKETEAGLAKFLPSAKDRIAKALRGARRTRVVGDLTPAMRDQIRALGLPGVSFEREEGRVYPLGTSAVQLIGFTDSGGKGLGGAEAAFERELAGSDKPVALSLDLRVQAALDQEVGKAFAEFHPLGAVGMVIDTQTGEVLGMSSWPNYDPNKGGSADQRQSRAANALYEMGSTFKAFTMAAGIDAGAVTTATRFDVTKPLTLQVERFGPAGQVSRGLRTIHDMRGEKRGFLTVTDIFTNSSNIGTAQIAEKIGRSRLKTYFDNLGLTRRNPVELPESARPLLPARWDDDAMISASFGHGLKVTPVALAQAYSGIINDGVSVPLTIRKRQGPPPAGTRVVSAKTSATMLEIMRANVVRGTGKSAAVAGIPVGGKTGTGEKVVNGRYDTYKQVSSFAAAFPTNGGPGTKRYFVLVLLDEPNGAVRTGGWVAAPAVGRVIDRIAPFLGVERQNLAGERILSVDGVMAADEEGEEGQ